MNIRENEEKGLFTLSPTNGDEEAFLVAVKTSLSIGQSLEYNGRSGAEIRAPYSERMILAFKLEGQRHEIQASSDESEDVIRSIRDAVFLSAGKLILQGHSEADGKIAVDFCTTFCKLCNAPIISPMRTHWKVCRACSDKCSHEWKEGMVNNGGLPGYGEYCSKCGTGKPQAEGERKRTKIEQELDIQNKLGIKIVYKGDDPPRNPEEAIKMNRLIKRYRRAKVRR